MQPGHFQHECPWIPDEILKRIRESRAAWAFAQGRTPWNPPAAKAPTGQAEEEQTAVRLEPGTGPGEAQLREPVSILEPKTDTNDAVPKTRKGQSLQG